MKYLFVNIAIFVILPVFLDRVACVPLTSAQSVNSQAKDDKVGASEVAGKGLEGQEQQQQQKAAAEATAEQKQPTTVSVTPVPVILENSSTTTERIINGGIGDTVTRNWDALIRSVYVFGTLSLIGFLYLGLRTWRLRRRRSGNRRTGSRRYAPLSTSRGLQQEMEPLGHPEDEDDDEDTVFDTSLRNSH